MVNCSVCNYNLDYPRLASQGKSLNNCPRCGHGRIRANLEQGGYTTRDSLQ